ncbi:ABC transporter substrate-binding protein [Enterovirga rhinocerotis]|uniref:Branched-chain amino acid transport system substrate-binding protein n=1 Tax=Enterovirga rhinocerotis TaxID=1339210 RepID=A0A4V6PZJ2_9HYPH|nr:ABC transporter substrate-binding protein [Enterovirga rhinocerotis]TDR90059.1 branched-chain amino acid transport system substrate-binding protein [Enterovirga rhinocerotis]
MGWKRLVLALAASCAMTAAVAQDKVKIGVLTDLSGVLSASTGPTDVEAARMAIEDFGGSVLGQPIELISADHQNKPDLASVIARSWFDTEGVTAIADVPNSAAALAVQGIIKDRKKIALFSGPATARLFNEDCAATSFHWVFDTRAIAHGLGNAILAQGGKDWFLVAADYAFGAQMAKDLDAIVKARGGRISGIVRHPTNVSDYSSFLLQAQASGAKIVAFANAGFDTINAIKQANEFGIVAAGQKIAALVVVISDIHSLGLAQTQGLVSVTAFYHDRDEASRAWSKRFFDRTGRMPGQFQAGVYSAVQHYLRAVRDAKTTEANAVAEAMRARPVDDFFAPGAKIRKDGRLMNDMYLFEVKKPADSKGPWDLWNIVARLPAEEIIAPLSESTCPLVKAP